MSINEIQKAIEVETSTSSLREEIQSINDIDFLFREVGSELFCTCRRCTCKRNVKAELDIVLDSYNDKVHVSIIWVKPREEILALKFSTFNNMSDVLLSLGLTEKNTGLASDEMISFELSYDKAEFNNFAYSVVSYFRSQRDKFSEEKYPICSKLVLFYGCGDLRGNIIGKDNTQRVQMTIQTYERLIKLLKMSGSEEQFEMSGDYKRKEHVVFKYHHRIGQFDMKKTIENARIGDYLDTC